MKLRAKLDPPRAATGKFPFPHRTCAEWSETEPHRDMSQKERHDDAREGSAKLRDALRKAAA
jgi:hypothetical protein